MTRFALFVRACVETDQRRKARKRRVPSIVTTHHEGEASVPLTAYDPAVAPLHAPPQYYDYAKPAVQVNVAEHPIYQQQPRY